MADADEDAIPSTPQNYQDDGEDGEDETQDYRFLATLTGGKPSVNTKRGMKDFEPNPTQSQASALDESRLAMYNALKEVRSQSERNHNVGQFVDDRSRGNPWDLKLRGNLRGSDWDARCVVLYKFKSTFSRTFGRADHRSWTWLLPEEALYLLERGTLDIRWPDIPASKDSAGDGEQDGAPASAAEGTDEETSVAEPIGELPMSLQAAYATFAGRNGLNMDRYLVFTGLRRLGYVVQRAASWFDFEDDENDNPDLEDDATVNIQPTGTPSASPTLIARLINLIANPRRGTSQPSHGPLLAPGLYRNYNDVFRSLQLIPHHSSLLPPHTPPAHTKPSPTGPFTIAFDVWRPATAYKKSAPPPPDFRICVLDARATDAPTMEQIGVLLDTMPTDQLDANKRAEAKIKHGKRSVILAVVDIGVVSYLRFGEAEVGSYRIYEDKTARAQKGRGGGRGGRGGARGRGGGLGRGRGRGRGKT